MALSVQQRVALVAPAFATNATLDAYVEMAEETIGASSFGGAGSVTRAQAVALCAAHFIALANDAATDGVGGAVTAKREGDLSVSYAAPAGGADFEQTKYGRALLEHAARTNICIGVV